MNEEKSKNNNDANQAEGIPVEHAVFIIPIGLLQSITNYLTSKPYREVTQFLQVLSQIKASDKRELNIEE